MKITITGRHMQVHDSVKDYCNEKASKLERFNDALRHVEIILSQDGDRKRVEMVATSRVGGRHVGQVEHEDAFAAIDLLVDKMKRQLERTKEKRKNRKHGESARHMQPGEPPAAKNEKEEDLETYDDVIEKMEL
ncbi:ribosome-associated translation inhibitor RaiA [bacterium]|nr:ribosome-associated translation inhibitor RaiA [bacterium]